MSENDNPVHAGWGAKGLESGGLFTLNASHGYKVEQSYLDSEVWFVPMEIVERWATPDVIDLIQEAQIGWPGDVSKDGLLAKTVAGQLELPEPESLSVQVIETAHGDYVCLFRQRVKSLPIPLDYTVFDVFHLDP